ncbi:Cell wall-associated hydrolase, NlpC family [Microlunatus sagamiharensis]|uniref:Cell wall-associated hydrolase, NlpC family n=1 Tax=Microlunatus sagamiharensis TaxID=546874 RepID=A0A1H2MX97_9ACTN|nr:C40 family peptidase [Microlunatus sagamiharensis]SDU97933.1 Cell wall-associated hydrolase, NlpC family [Microlunatus sagamiharensis]
MKVQSSRIATGLVALAMSVGLLAGTAPAASADDPAPAPSAAVITGTAAPAAAPATTTAKASTAKASTAKKAAAKKKKAKTRGDKALAYAKKQLGDKYKYGAAGPNRWDCSGLTMKAWGSAGKKLPHSAKGQSTKGKKVKKSQLRKGDLVFFYSGTSHVGIYAGDGKVIHAPKPGSKVSYIKMKYMPFKTARRPG